MVKKGQLAAVDSTVNIAGDVPQNSVIERLSQYLQEKADACQRIIIARSGPLEGVGGSDKIDQAAESSALDVQRSELERVTATMERIVAIQHLIAQGWQGTCTAEKPEGGQCGVQIPFVRLEGALGTTVCIDCAGGGKRRRSHYR